MTESEDAYLSSLYKALVFTSLKHPQLKSDSLGGIIPPEHLDAAKFFFRGTKPSLRQWRKRMLGTDAPETLKWTAQTSAAITEIKFSEAQEKVFAQLSAARDRALSLEQVWGELRARGATGASAAASSDAPESQGLTASRGPTGAPPTSLESRGVYQAMARHGLSEPAAAAAQRVMPSAAPLSAWAEQASAPLPSEQDPSPRVEVQQQAQDEMLKELAAATAAELERIETRAADDVQQINTLRARAVSVMAAATDQGATPTAVEIMKANAREPFGTFINPTPAAEDTREAVFNQVYTDGRLPNHYVHNSLRGLINERRYLPLQGSVYSQLKQGVQERRAAQSGARGFYISQLAQIRQAIMTNLGAN